MRSEGGEEDACVIAKHSEHYVCGISGWSMHMNMTVPRKRVKKSPAAVSLDSEYSALLNAQSFNYLLMSGRISSNSAITLGIPGLMRSV